MQKIPYLLVIGEKEEKENTVAVRERGKGDIGTMKIEELVKKIS
jgi:threonyl-tRNA synthetase